MVVVYPWYIWRGPTGMGLYRFESHRSSCHVVSRVLQDAATTHADTNCNKAGSTASSATHRRSPVFSRSRAHRGRRIVWPARCHLIKFARPARSPIHVDGPGKFDKYTFLYFTILGPFVSKCGGYTFCTLTLGSHSCRHVAGPRFVL